MESSYSDSTQVTSGVPQGSVLGPLLFVMFINNLIAQITTKCKHVSIYAFADDIKLLSTDTNNLQLALDIVTSWTQEWGLLLNTDKSEHITFREKKHTITLLLQIKLFLR